MISANTGARLPQRSGFRSRCAMPTAGPRTSRRDIFRRAIAKPHAPRVKGRKKKSRLQRLHPLQPATNEIGGVAPAVTDRLHSGRVTDAGGSGPSGPPRAMPAVGTEGRRKEVDMQPP